MVRSMCMKKKNIVIVAIIGFAAILLTAVAFYANDGEADPEKPGETDGEPDTQVAQDEVAEADYNYSPKKAEQVLADQEELETAMLAESEGSTLNNPYV